MIITISGSPGAGKTRIARRVAQALGFRFLSIGDIRRSLAREHDVSQEELTASGEREYWTDDQIDDHVEELGASYEHLVISSRFGFHLVPGSFKIRLTCDPLVTAQRLQAADDDRFGDSVEEIVSTIDERVRADRERGMRFYDKDPHDASQFDLALDISRLDEDQVVELLTKGLLGLRESWTNTGPEHI